MEVDIAPSKANLTDTSRCSQLWSRSPGAMTLTFSYSEPNGVCQMSATEEIRGNSVVRHGALGVFVVAQKVGSGEVFPVGGWLYDIEVHIPRTVQGSFEFLAWDLKDARETISTEVGPLSAKLSLFTSGAFAVLQTPAIVRSGDTMFLQLSLSSGSESLTQLPLHVTTAWLSRDSDGATIVQNLTATIQEIETGTGMGHFTAVASTCSSCYLHVAGDLSAEGRRLVGRSLREEDRKVWLPAPLLVEVQDHIANAAPARQLLLGVLCAVAQMALRKP